ncbi:thioredoxin, mitochondrial [Drosophila virilis]|uniref:Thioredoxin domain-containing protein n=1 Tax=Drosophila virilis TaxID=7244 RepID=B4LPY4_DROVI|nr:thioredoxin, mitochondrial [Drosophila virilis]EDW60307.2 uncharacterized protein Dvir_GJ20933 [Drosophila virilis]
MSAKMNSIQLRLLKHLLSRSYRNSPSKRAIFDIANMKEFEKKVKGSKLPVLVDFHASWCTPCKALTPRLANIISEQRGRLRMARVDIDEFTDLALDYNVGSVPSLLVMHNGKVLNRLVGLQTSEYIRNWLAKVIKNCSPN